MNDNFCVNFYDKKLSLYVNDVLCAKRSFIVLVRGTPENEWHRYEHPIGEEGRRALSRFDIGHDFTWIKHRSYFDTEWCFCLVQGAHTVFRNGKLYEDDIHDLMLKIEYEPRVESVSMEKLLRYPADLVIDYLKERGITSCPILPNSLQ